MLFTPGKQEVEHVKHNPRKSLLLPIVFLKPWHFCLREYSENKLHQAMCTEHGRVIYLLSTYSVHFIKF